MDNFIGEINFSNIDIEINTKMQEHIDIYLLKLYKKLLDICYISGKKNEAMVIQKRYITNRSINRIYSFGSEGDNLESEILKELPIKSDYEFNSDLDKEIVIKFLLQRYKQSLRLELIKFCKEEILVFFYGISSILSYISVSQTYIYKSKYNNEFCTYKNMVNMIVDTINLFRGEERVKIGGVLGVEKKSCEYVINFILNEQMEYSNNKAKSLSLDNIFIITKKIIETLCIKKGLSGLRHYGINIKIKNWRLRLDKEFEERFMLYLRDIYEQEYDINSDEVKIIFEVFDNNEGYSPNILERYIISNEKNLITDIVVNIVEDKFLYKDIIICTQSEENSVEKLIQSLVLKKSNRDVDEELFSEDNRIFRTPIIAVGNQFILSFYLLIESVHYLRYRILRRGLSKSKQIDKKIKRLYDEKELSVLKKLIDDYGIIGGMNIDLQKKHEVNKLFLNQKNVTKEIDFYFIFNGILYTMEYKNQDIDRTIHDIGKSYSRNEENVKKHIRMLNIIKDNRYLFEEVLGEKFIFIKSFLVFKNKNSFTYFYKGNDIISCTYDEFYRWCKNTINK